MNKSKYRNIKTIVDGIKFDSKLEARRYGELKDQRELGYISNLVLQESFIVIPKQVGERATAYKADFSYTDLDGNKVVEDTKSKATATPEYIIKRKLMLFVFGIRIKEVYR
jgi:hypothetical protein